MVCLVECLCISPIISFVVDVGNWGLIVELQNLGEPFKYSKLPSFGNTQLGDGVVANLN
jgi:hypothetical protein